jgi:Asp/Glu/hydantoin racemase
MENHMTIKRRIISLCPTTKEPLIRDMDDSEKHQYYFGESVGMLVFRPWYQCIPYKGHTCYTKSYDFPIRLSFVDDPIDPQGFVEGRAEWRGWNLPNWIAAAQQLEEDGVRAIVGGCGLTGKIQSLLSAAVDIPVYSSSVMFVPMVHKGLAQGKRVGILTVSEAQFRSHDNILLSECGIDDSIPIAISGMNESAGAETWLTMTTPEYDVKTVEQVVVDAAMQLKKDYPDLGAIVLECTEMPIYSAAVRAATGLPVFDAIDMVNWVNNLVDN